MDSASSKDTPVLRFPGGSGLSHASDPEAAFEALHARMYEPLRHYAEVELQDADVAADVVQGAFVHIWERYFKDQPSVDRLFDALACRIVQHRLRNYRRDRYRQARKFSEYLKVWGSQAKRWMLPTAAVDHAELVSVIDGALAKMSPRSREVFMMRREGEVPFKRIAELLNVSDETVRSLMHKAQVTLRKHVDKAGFGAEARRRLLSEVTRDSRGRKS